MKIEQISLYNFSGYAKVTVNLNENVTYLIGKNGAGKSTLGITAIWFVMNGIAEKTGVNNPLIGERFRFIGGAATKAQGQIVFVDEKTENKITVTRTLRAAGSDLKFEGSLPGVELSQAWLTGLFNEFLIAPKRFQDLTPMGQAKALGIDTAKFDKDIADLKGEATKIRYAIKNMGDIAPVAEAKNVNIQELTTKRADTVTRLSAEKKAIADKLNALYVKTKADNKELRDAWEIHKKQIDDACWKVADEIIRIERVYSECTAAIATLKKHHIDCRSADDHLLAYFGTKPEYATPESLYLPEPEYKEERPDDTELAAFETRANQEIAAIDAQIQAANLNNQNAFLYGQYLEKTKAKQAQEDLLKANQVAQAETAQARIDFIKAFDMPFDGMNIDENGGLTLNGREIKDPYFSSGELMKIVVTLMSRKNPELKYVFLRDFQLLDEDKQTQIVSTLEEMGFQMVIEMVGKEKIVDKNCILLKECEPVESYEESKKAVLI